MTRTLSSYLALLIFLAISPLLSAANYLAVNIDGIEDDLLSNVKNTLDIMQEKRNTPANDLSERAIKRSYNQATKQIQAALRPFGYYQPNVESKLIQKENRWTANFKVDKGPPTIIKELNIVINGAGNKNKATQLLLDKQTLTKGDKLNHKTYSNFKDALYNSLFEAGYIDANYTKNELAVDIKKNSAYISLTINSGEKFYFGDIKIDQTVIDEEKLQQINTIDKNTPFNTDHLLELQLKLTDTGFFANTEIQVERNKTIDKHIPVLIKTTPSKKLKYSSSVGYGTDTGARVGFSFLNRRINKRGHRFQSSIQLSQVDNSLSTSYAIPIGDINSEFVDIFANVDQEKLNDVDTTQYNVGLSLNENRWGGRTRASLTLLKEDFSFDNLSNQTANLLIPGITYSYKKSDNTFFTTKGYSFNTNLHGGIESVLSEISFLHLNLQAKSIFSINSHSRLLTRIELGSIQTNEFEKLPPSERFFTGGAQSIRGYDFKDIGARDALGNNIGGDQLITASIEVDHLPWGNFGYAVFFDTGNASIGASPSLLKSAGIGLRYRSVIGMIRFDLAHPFDDPKNDVQFHISIGPDL